MSLENGSSLFSIYGKEHFGFRSLRTLMFSSLSIRVWLCAFPSDHFKLIAFKLTGVADDPGLPYRMSLLVVALE